MPVTEDDFRKPEFKGADPRDYEIGKDGKIVRKDRWQRAAFQISKALGFNDADKIEAKALVDCVQQLVTDAAAAGVLVQKTDWLPPGRAQ